MATESDWRLKRIGSGLQRLISQLECAVSSGESFEMHYHPMVEVKIGAFWIPVDPGSDDAESAAAGLPLPRLGYDPIILRGYKGSVVARSKAYPIGISLPAHALFPVPVSARHDRPRQPPLRQGVSRWGANTDGGRSR
jgi:hypothetical protein